MYETYHISLSLDMVLVTEIPFRRRDCHASRPTGPDGMEKTNEPEKLPFAQNPKITEARILAIVTNNVTHT